MIRIQETHNLPLVQALNVVEGDRLSFKFGPPNLEIPKESKIFQIRF